MRIRKVVTFMGEYTRMSVNTHLNMHQTYELSYLITGLNGNLTNVVSIFDKQDDKKRNGIIHCFPGEDMNFFINEKNEIVLENSVKALSYQAASAYKFGLFKTMERLANYIGNCEVRITSDDSIEAHPMAKDGVYEYTTPPKENSLNRKDLKEKASNYAATKINLDLMRIIKNREIQAITDNQNSFFYYDANKLILKHFTNNIKNPTQLANVTSFLYIRNKNDIDFTKKEVQDYLNRPTYNDVTKAMKCIGLSEFFESIQRIDLSNFVKREYQIVLEQENYTNLKRDYDLLLKSSSFQSWIKDGERAVTITKYDKSDFHHFKNEIMNYPFGAETLMLHLFETNKKEIFIYQNQGKKITRNNLYQLLDMIQHPEFLNELLQNMKDVNASLSFPLSNYITETEILQLESKISQLKINLEQKQLEELEKANVHRIYLKVPYREKEEASLLGARWSSEMKAWYISRDDNPQPFEKWLPSEPEETLEER